MPRFIESCNCRGTRPKQIVGHGHVPRPEIIARLLKDRHVARFLIAPVGFGKSSIAYEYAHLVFGFSHVFWIRGDSPCFLRDLDAMTIFDEIEMTDPHVNLVVFDDIPQLDAERSQRFADLVDALINKQSEVIALSTPSADTFSALERDAACLRSRDLLVSEDEIAPSRLSSESAYVLEAAPATARVPCLCWDEEGAALLMKGLRNEVLPAAIKQAMLSMLLLGSGELDEVFEGLSDQARNEAIELLDVDYCFFGIDRHASTFAAIEVEIHLLMRQFDFDQILGALGIEGDEWAISHATMLLEHGRPTRACTLLQKRARKEACARWIVEHARFMFMHMFLSDLALFCDFARSSGRERPRILLIKAWCMRLLACREELMRIITRLDAMGTVSPDIDVQRALLMFLCSEKVNPGDISMLLAHAEISRIQGSGEDGDEPSCAHVAFFGQALGLLSAILKDHSACSERIIRLVQEGEGTAAGFDAPHRGEIALVAILLALRFVELALNEHGAGERELSPEWELSLTIQELCELTRVLARAIQSDQMPALPEGDHLLRACAMMKCEQVGGMFAPPLTFEWQDDLRAEAKSVRTALETERMAFARHINAANAKRTEYRLSHPDPYRLDEPSAEEALRVRTATPILSIKLFGGLSVFIGGTGVDPRLLSAKRVRTVLCIMALNLGKEVTKEKMASLIWPEDGMAKYRSNFYNIWFKLKRALSVDEVCPYLIRTQTGTRLDERFVTCDIVGFEELCRSMLFGFEDLDSWERLYSRLVENFSDDLLPGDFDCEHINALREQYRAQVVDAMISASRKLLRQGIADGALWFAREAMRRDDKREDSYITLMEAQIASDQRGYAIQTYFDCRTFLREELGIDPSLKVVDLYRSIIEAEEELI